MEKEKNCMEQAETGEKEGGAVRMSRMLDISIMNSIVMLMPSRRCGDNFNTNLHWVLELPP